MRKFTPDDLEKMQEYYNECQSTRKVAKKFECSKFTVSRYIKINSPNTSNLTPEEYDIKRKQDKVKNVIEWRKRTKIKLVEYKGGECVKCGYKKSISALSFHHLDPTKKDFTISSKTYSFERLKKEVDKCILVCSNCHIEIHEELNLKNNLVY